MGDEASYDEGNDKPLVWTDGQGVTHYRASALGGCTTAAIIVRSGFTPMAPPKSMQDRFNEGHLHEPDIVRRANTEFGLEVFAKDPATNRQYEVQVPVTTTVVIDGHTDGKCLGMVTDEPDYWNTGRGTEFEDSDLMTLAPGEFRVFEAKTMSHAAFTRWVKMSWAERWAAYPGYAKQMTVYLAGMSLLDGVDYEKWVYAVKNKESGQVIVEPGIGYPYSLPAIKAQVLGIEAHVRQGLPIPEACHPGSQWPCPVYYIGPCGDDNRTTLDERQAEVVVALGVTYQEAKEREAEAKRAKEIARDEIKKHLPDGGKFDADGWKVAFSKRRSKGTVSQERFDMERFLADHPDLAEQYTTTEEVEQWTSERLTVTPPKDRA
jgi:hypothetical protein